MFILLFIQYLTEFLKLLHWFYGMKSYILLFLEKKNFKYLNFAVLAGILTFIFCFIL